MTASSMSRQRGWSDGVVVVVNVGKCRGSVYFNVRAFEARADGWYRYRKFAPGVVSSSSHASNGGSGGNFFSWEKKGKDEDVKQVVEMDVGGGGGRGEEEEGTMIASKWKYGVLAQ